MQRGLKKGYVAWIVAIGEEETNEVNIHETPIMNEFMDVFRKELLGLPPDQEVKFTIDLLPSMKPISIPLYQMALA